MNFAFQKEDKQKDHFQFIMWIQQCQKANPFSNVRCASFSPVCAPFCCVKLISLKHQLNSLLFSRLVSPLAQTQECSQICNFMNFCFFSFALISQCNSTSNQKNRKFPFKTIKLVNEDLKLDRNQNSILSPILIARIRRKRRNQAEEVRLADKKREAV